MKLTKDQIEATRPMVENIYYSALRVLVNKFPEALGPLKNYDNAYCRSLAQHMADLWEAQYGAKQ